MNITANNVASKLFVAFVAAAMLFTLATPAKAQTAEELQAQINALMAQIAALQSSTGGSSATVAACTFTRALTVGSQGEDVKCLQNALTPKYFTNASGATGYFGPVTQSAVAAWQAANGITPAVGYFGPVSQAKYNAMMTETPADDSDDSDDSTDDSDDSDDSDNGDLSGEASLDVAEINDADDSDIEEGQDAAEIAELDVEFTDGDAMITRLDIILDKTSQDPWDVFGEVTLWVDGDEVGSIDASDEDNYLDEDDGSLRFSGLDIVAMEDETVTITVAADIQNNLDTNDKGDWNVYAAEMRYVDADDVTTTDTDTDDLEDSTNSTLTGNKAVATVENEGADDEVLVKTSSTDPESTTLQLDTDKKSDFLTIFAFDLDTDDSTNDVEVNEIVVTVASTEDGTVATSTELLINDAMLVIDGEEFDDVTITNNGGTFTFDIDGDLMIDAGDRVTVEFQAEFKSLANPLEGATVQASITGSTGVDSEGADTITASGAATGDEHTVRTSGAILDLTDTSESKDTNSDTTTTDDEGVFTLEFEVTAFEADLYVAKSAASTTGTGSGVAFRITDGSGTLVGTSSVPTASLSSTAASETGTDSVSRFKVAEGDTETFTLTVTLDPEVSGFYGVQIYGLNFKIDNTGAAIVNQQLALPSEDFETDPISI